ncbi:tail fiber assembly protein [Pseudomonas sp. MWU12-3103b]|uniref:tail fiber assembly protein n=1 Tax=Pseudomonas sp. MWU12-3103b TaxID=2928857 RepID=UPI001FFF3631|nr:tail fiber assembly protein [Pseudomonas sp. MWU12-3103b]
MYLITEKSWLAVSDPYPIPLSPEESLVEALPDWLLEKARLDQVERQAREALSSLQVAANQIILPLQDDADLQEITAGNLERLKAWKRYRSALGKVPEQAGWPQNPEWPSAPE